jgi:glycosyltransferase involved in cell wall biosynthesis
MKSTFVSILMPAYNGERYLDQALQSVLGQSHESWELIVVDDGSTDGTASRVAAYGDRRIRYVYQPNQGQAAALNRGLTLAQGEYITTLDVDDWFTPHSLALRVEFLEQHPECGAVYGDGYYCNLKGELLRPFSTHWLKAASGDVYEALVRSPFFGTGANVLIRRHVLTHHQLCYDESIVWCQDWDLYLRLAEKSHFGVIPQPTVWYRLHETNMTLSLPAGRRLASLITLKHKVLASPRFGALSEATKVSFFYGLLLSDLALRPSEQKRILDHPHFQALTPKQQARLIRLVAIDHLFAGDPASCARSLLHKAWSLAPFDPATGLISMLAGFNLQLTTDAVKQWRRLRAGNQHVPSVLELAKGG